MRRMVLREVADKTVEVSVEDTTPSRSDSRPSKQGTLLTFIGLEWICRQIFREVAQKAVEVSDYMTGADTWEEWKEEVEEEHKSKRSENEERRLWRMLEECDREQAKEDEGKSKKEKKRVVQARMRMRVRKDQPTHGSR